MVETARARSATEPLLVIQGVSKSFSGVPALTDVDLTLEQGELLAVIGENGAGKSTLMKILAGVLPSDRGRFRLRGQDIDILSVRDALGRGIALIHQELNLAPNLDLGANIFLGREPRLGPLIDRHRIRREAHAFLKMVGLQLSPDRLVSSLSIGQQQLVEIAKALAVDARILIMDEPTSSLSRHETRRLFEVIHDLKGRGVSLIYISHRLGEVLSLADRVAVLRDGRNAGELKRQDLSRDRMVRLMVGRDISRFYHHLDRETGPRLLDVEKLRTRDHPDSPVSFSLRRGEIVGIAGLVGAGRTGVLETLFGIRSPLAGSVRVAGRSLAAGRPLESIRSGLALVPEDRKSQALILDMAVRINLSLVRVGRDQRFGFLNTRKEALVTGRAMERLRIRSVGPEQVVRYLSGGNQQKVVLGRWLVMDPAVLLLDEPTRGVDVGSKEEIYRLIEQMAARGVAVLFVSSEMEEILGLADRVLVMHEGSLAGELSREELSEERIMEMATGSPRLEPTAPGAGAS